MKGIYSVNKLDNTVFCYDNFPKNSLITFLSGAGSSFYRNKAISFFNDKMYILSYLVSSVVVLEVNDSGSINPKNYISIIDHKEDNLSINYRNYYAKQLLTNKERDEN
jgi:hypothetical protein